MIRTGLIVGLLMMAIGVATGQQPKQPLKLDELISEALEKNPDLQAARKQWEAAKAGVPQAGALPDPVLSFSLANLPVDNWVFNQEPMSGKKLAVMQMFPFPGKLGLKEDIAEDRATALEAQYLERKDMVVRDVKLVYFDLFFIDRAIETIEKNKSLIEEFVRIAETRYSVGKGLQQDVLKAQVELSKMQDRLITMQQQRQGVAARLNRLLNRAVDSPVGQPKEPGIFTFSKSLSELQRLAIQNRKLLKAWEAMVRQSENKLKLARKSYLPDFSVSMAYTQRDVLASGMGGTDYFSGSVSLNLPIFFYRKQKKQVEEQTLNQTAVQRQYENIRNVVFSEIQKRLSDLQRDQTLLELYKTGIIPQASQSLQAALTGYQTDKVDFITLLNNEITLFNYELEYYRVLSSFHKNVAILEALTGTHLSE